MTPNGINGTFARMKMHAPVAAALAIMHFALVAGSIHLHTPHDHARANAISIADLPAYLHHHDYRFDRGSDIDRWTDEDCIGCRLERAPATPATIDGLEVESGIRSGSTPIVASARTTSSPLPPSRAPPAA